jgi:hypothetical protein
VFNKGDIIMKAYLTGPRIKQTINLKGVVFVNGVAEVSNRSVYLERYYGVVYSKPIEYEDEILQVVEEEELSEDGDEKELAKIVEEKKRQITSEPPQLKLSPEEQLKQFTNFGEMSKYVRQKTGLSPRTKAKAIEYLEKYSS